MNRPGLRPETLAVTSGRPHGAGEPLNVPPVLASSLRAGGERTYARSDGTPTWEALEEAVGALEGGQAVAFASGMAAVAAVLDDLPQGARIAVVSDGYQGVQAALDDGVARRGWSVRRVAAGDAAGWTQAAGDCDLLWVESPTNPLLELCDLPALGAAARAAGVPLVVDNTFATPLLQRPFEHGASYVIHSATKFLGGHSDLVAGVALAREDARVEALRRRRVLSGATLGALEAYLALRGLRTLPVRLARAQESAGVLATRLAAHDEVTRVRYPGLPGDPGHALASRDLAGFGAMLSVEVRGGGARADALCAALRLIVSATSLGGVESSIERRAKLAGQEHLPPSLLRLSVGCEHVEDLWEDLRRGLEATRG